MPEFFNDEDQLREIWSQQDTRQRLLDGLQAKGCSDTQLTEISKMLGAERNELFDVLVHLSFSLPMKTREQRVVERKALINKDL